MVMAMMKMIIVMIPICNKECFPLVAGDDDNDDDDYNDKVTYLQQGKLSSCTQSLA